MALAERGREAFEQPGLLLGRLDGTLGGGLNQPQQPLVLGQQAVRCRTPRMPPAQPR